MKTTEVIESHVLDLKFAHLDKNDILYDLENYSDLDDIDDKDKLKFIFESIVTTFDLLVQLLHDDLADIWQRLDVMK